MDGSSGNELGTTSGNGESVRAARNFRNTNWVPVYQDLTLINTIVNIHSDRGE